MDEDRANSLHESRETRPSSDAETSASQYPNPIHGGRNHIPVAANCRLNSDQVCYTTGQINWHCCIVKSSTSHSRHSTIPQYYGPSPKRCRSLLRFIRLL